MSDEKKPETGHTTPPDLARIEAVINRDIRPALQMHGGDLEVLDYQDKILRIRYEGACGGCPSAMFGTLQMIESALKEKIDPEISVIPG
ncbi:MAG: NifU family protein [Candidatus Omnitrophota bacterium]